MSMLEDLVTSMVDIGLQLETPSNSTVQTSGQINMSNLTGMSMSALTTDPCGETRGVKGGRTTGTTTKTIYARYQTGGLLVYTIKTQSQE